MGMHRLKSSILGFSLDCIKISGDISHGGGLAKLIAAVSRKTVAMPSPCGQPAQLRRQAMEETGCSTRVASVTEDSTPRLRTLSNNFDADPSHVGLEGLPPKKEPPESDVEDEARVEAVGDLIAKCVIALHPAKTEEYGNCSSAP